MKGQDVGKGCAAPAVAATLRSHHVDGPPARRAQPAVDGVTVAVSATSPLAVLGSGPLTAYWRFQRAVAAAQLHAWLPRSGTFLVDISGPQSRGAIQAAAAGHIVLRVAATPPAPPELIRAGVGRGRIATVVADSANLSFLADGCADGVIADDSTLSRHLVAEDVAAEIARVLRPGGQLFACVDSLVLGMAILAEQHHWAQLTDVPHAEVVLVPWPDGTITRCFGSQHLSDLLTEAGLEVRWIRPRTVLSPSMVDHVLRKNPGSIARLIRAELGAVAGNGAGDESFGIYLLAAASKPGPRLDGRHPAAGNGRPARQRRGLWPAASDGGPASTGT
jgi:SAM-dependent methyltransferase